MTAQDLKNSILQLAVEGKLLKGGSLPLATAGKPSSATPSAGTPRNAPSDQKTGAELLQQIKAEKEKLIAEGKIKKDTTKAGASGRALAEITEDEIPFDIPESWCWCRLGEIGDWGAGATPQRGNPDYYQNGTIPWIKTGELNNGIVSEACEFITEKALNECSLRYNRVGDVLIAMYGATIGKLAIAGIELTTNQACCACTCHNGVYNKYLFYFLMSQKSVFEKKAEGGAQPNISREKIVKTLIPLPPLAEQKAIVAKIEELLPYIQKYDVAHTKLQEFNKKFPVDMQKSILQQAIMGKLVPQLKEDGNAKDLLEKIKAQKARLIAEGKIKKDKPLAEITEDEKPFDIPESWCWVKFGDLCERITGKTPERANDIYWNKGKYNWVSISDMTDYGFVKETKESISEEASVEYWNKRISQKNSLLMSFKLTVGRTSILDIDAYHNEAIITIKPFVDEEYAIRNYFFYSLPLLTKMGDFKDAIKGRTLNKDSIANLLIPLPPLAEQKRIVEKIEELLPLCKKLVK
ncbi:restriction endonuclease subunit S [Treponema peruense]|uniref:Restriction endonuclease subunit S n=1 Tax=Treponema peruense TaxID=2787628 RepID=A0A7T3RDN4_9SPIR|nr:restriction endonuclease subunit S [Treponema peruense]QQA01231.1 restriction endonuclease subunit S [Treponema peruense]